MKKVIQENKFYIIFMVVLVAICHIQLPYYVNAPGGVIDISDRIQYDRAKNYEGSLNMLYVTEYVATIPTYLLSYVIPDWDLEDVESSQLSDETPEEIDMRNKVMLENSINNAKYVAYKAAGCQIEVKDLQNIVIGTTLKNSFKIGDELLEIDGKQITTTNDIKELIDKKEVGKQVKVKIKRNHKEIEKRVEVKEADGKKVLGIVVITNYTYEMDPEVEFQFKKSESGSSGGLMMALSIYTALNEEDILKGRKIAGTGTIDINGQVGEIAGIKYKIMGAAKNKMDVVLVPTANYEEAIKVVKEKNYDMEIVKVENFADAINYLKTNN